MAVVLDRSTRCLCCDVLVLVSSAEWAQCEAPAAVCKDCYGFVPHPVLRVFYLMRCQISGLIGELTSLKRDVSRLYKAQKDVEEALIEGH